MTDSRVLAVGSPPTFRMQVARALEADPSGVDWLPSVTALESQLADGSTLADVVVLSPAVKDPDAFGLAEFMARTSPASFRATS